MGVLHTLKQRVKFKNLKDFYVFDIETGDILPDGSIQWRLHGRPETFRFGVVYGDNFSKVIYSVTDFINEFKDKRYKNKKVFAHNAGGYDLNVLYGNFFKAMPDAIFSGTRFICASNGNCIFCDSMNIFDTKLEKIAKMLGMVKPQLGNEKMLSKNGIDAAAINRCYMDCVILYDALLSVFSAAGDIRITQASLSMTYFRRFHQAHALQYNDNTPFFFDSYYGGRTEAFKLGPTNASVIDVNSMYPYAMKVSRFPNPRELKIEFGKSWKPKQLYNYFINQILYNYEGLIYCTVYHSETSPYGFLPYKFTDKTGGRKLIFPVGRFTGCWNFPEIRFALEQGAIQIEKIDRIVYAPGMPSPFVSFVDTLYRERFKTDNEFEIYRIKIFMNSLYGKFGQRLAAETIYIDDIQKRYDEIIRPAQMDGTFVDLKMYSTSRPDALLILKTKGQEVPHSIPSFSSYITSFCRVLLLKKILELHSKRVVYCDTDSIFFEVNNGVASETHLGGWKVENKIITEINGLKNYKYEYIDPATGELVKKRRLKGVPEKADLIAPNTYAYENLLKTKESLRRNLEPGVLTKRIKVIKGTYDKRIILDNGDTLPITL